MAPKLDNYKNRCGGCLHFVQVRGSSGKCQTAPTGVYNHNNRRGKTYKAHHSNVRYASCPSCSRYIDATITEAEWMCMLMCSSIEED